VLYRVSTLHFETDAGDGFREPGFSKERQAQRPTRTATGSPAAVAKTSFAGLASDIPPASPGAWQASGS
jgi:hypothetical protein